MNNLSENELNLIKSKVSINRFVLESTMTKKLGTEFYKKLMNEKILESDKGKAKFNISFWNEYIKQKQKPKPKKTRKKSAKRTPTSSLNETLIESHIMNLLNPKFDSLVNMINNLDYRLKNIENKTSPSEPVTKSITSSEFKEILKKKYDLINFNERRGGMIPIPQLWDELHKEGIDRQQFEQELFVLERERVIELQIASDPILVKEREKSIEHPSRGLINYVVWRR